MNPAILVNLLIVAGLIVIMLSMGFKVSFEEVAESIRKPRLGAGGLVANFALVPAVTTLLLYVFDANPMLSV